MNIKKNIIKSGNKAIFFDRDGVIVEDIGYAHKIEDFKLLPNVIGGLRLLKNYKLVIITNQSGIGKGYYTLKNFNKFNSHLIKELEKNKIKIQKTYYCPHKPEDNCECRKPKIKFLKEAEKEFDIDLDKSFVIGDKKSDFKMGKNAGCRTIHVLTGYGLKYKHQVKPDYIAKDLFAAAQWIIKNDESQ